MRGLLEAKLKVKGHIVLSADKLRSNLSRLSVI